MDIFVFGSNLAGRHGAGSAREAWLHWGAILGQGIGLQGRSYAIPTKDTHLRTLPVSEIAKYVNEFLVHATNNPNDTFHVVAIGCGLAGYHVDEIRPLFNDRPENVKILW